VHAGPDFLDRIRDEPPGGVAIFSGRNRSKIDRIIAALEAGLHVLADKPAISSPRICRGWRRLSRWRTNSSSC
jgi:predicted dehydrogenase